jgi:hypothetical protein
VARTGLVVTGLVVTGLVVTGLVVTGLAGIEDRSGEHGEQGVLRASGLLQFGRLRYVHCYASRQA